MKIYNLKTCEQLIDKYIELGGCVSTLEEGTLGLGLTVLHSLEGFSSIVIKEVFINEWTSGHKVRQYKVLPKKYALALENIA